MPPLFTNYFHRIVPIFRQKKYFSKVSNALLVVDELPHQNKSHPSNLFSDMYKDCCMHLIFYLFIHLYKSKPYVILERN